MIINGQNISMIRGDTEALSVSMKKESESTPGTYEAVPFVSGDTVRLTVKKRPSEAQKSFQKVVTIFVEGIATIPIEYDDTKDLPTGTYFYDVQVNFADGSRKTIVGPAEFAITDEVTYE